MHECRRSYGYTENKIVGQIADTIAGLASRGYVLGICTSKPAVYAAKIVEMFQLQEYFSFIDGGDIGMQKVDQLSRLVANGLRPESASMIGDREIDISAAKGNGIASVGVLWGFGSREELQMAQPDHLLKMPAELLTLFG